MPHAEKYAPVFKLINELNIRDAVAFEEDGALKLKATAATQYDKDLILAKIIEVGGEGTHDIIADIEVEDTSAYQFHTASEGDTIEKISERYLGTSDRINEIKEANNDVIGADNNIKPGSKLKIPKR
jgi:nucleoid-associated protein YgaU